MLSFPLILTAVLLMAGGLLGVILLVVLLPRRDDGGARYSEPSAHSEERPDRLNGRNGERFTR